MRRREVIRAFGTAAAAWPFTAFAQQPSLPVIGYLSGRSPEDTPHLVDAFRKGLAENGYAEGRNVAVEYRWALGRVDRLPAMAAELARLPAAVIVSTGGEPPAQAAKAATSTIPIVFSIGRDPVSAGLVASYNRPGGNATGLSIITTALEGKRLSLLHELAPRTAGIAVLLNTSNPPAERQLADLHATARTLGRQLHVFRADTDPEVEAAFEAIAQRRIAALTVAGSPFFDTRRDKLVGLAARHALPTMYQVRDYAVAGGLMSYGIDLPDAYRQVGVYAGRILAGVKPADLPVMEPTKFEFVLNLKTAKGLGLDIPPAFLARADEVIE